MMSQLAEVFTNEDDSTNNIKYIAISFNLLQRLKQKKKGKYSPKKQLRHLSFWRNAENRKHTFSCQKADNVWSEPERKLIN